MQGLLVEKKKVEVHINIIFMAFYYWLECVGSVRAFLRWTALITPRLTRDARDHTRCTVVPLIEFKGLITDEVRKFPSEGIHL